MTTNLKNTNLVDVEIILSSQYVLFTNSENNLMFHQDHSNFDKAVAIALEYLDTEVIPQDRFQALVDLHSVVKAIQEWGNGRLVIAGSRVKFDEDYIPVALEGHLLTQFKKGNESALEAWSKFIEKLRDVSHTDTYNRLYEFLKFNDLSITPEGNVLAWKVVRPDFKDKHSGTFDNSPGSICSMPRVKVAHDPNRTCASGLHACAFSYLSTFSSFGDQVVLVEIDVRDIVSVPTDYNGSKIRCSKYTVRHHVGTWGVDGLNGSSDTAAILSKIL